MCDHCSDFQQLLFTVERNYASALEASETADRSDSELQPVLSAADVGVALQFLNVWHHKQCMCVFREVGVGELTVSMLYAFDWSTKSLFCILYLYTSANLYHDIRDGAIQLHETTDIRDPRKSLLLQDFTLLS